MATVERGRLAGKIAIVTGAGSGIGRGIAHVFAREGAKVVVAEIDADRGAKVVEEIEAEGGMAAFLQADMREEESVRGFIDKTVELFGGLDVLVNNAGYGTGKTVEESSAAEWDDMMGVNAKGAFLATKYATPHLRARGGGSIINIGSLFAHRGGPSFAIYHATKGAIRQLTKTSAVALAKDGIRVNIVHPGLIATPGANNASAKDIAALNLGPMGRWGRPEEIAYGCLFLASDEASFVTGIDLPVDGGYSV